jgi:hydroxymethylpyrimidine pyrophosphatase-like HAD family hydrolase
LPKGVMVTHANLMHNEQPLRACFEVTRASTVKVVRTSHSVDVIHASASKLRVLEHLVDFGLAARPNILCIGDR